MPILGLTSGKQIKLSKNQYAAFMKRREAYMGGVLIEVYDENKNPVGKIKTDCIEFVAPDNSPEFSDIKPFNSPRMSPVGPKVGVGYSTEKKKPSNPVKKT